MAGHIAILGVFVADTAYRADRAPQMGETILGNSFALGPGGKGSNQAVAAARAGGRTHFLTRLGKDTFADLALATWKDAGVIPEISQHEDEYTGAAYIFIEEATGNNAIIVCPGAGMGITPANIDACGDLIGSASVFVTQLEQPIDAAMRALEIAKSGGAQTILNPAPAAELPPEIFPLCDFVTPNESEAEGITGFKVTDIASAKSAADAFLDLGVGAALITLGENGALLGDKNGQVHVPAFNAGPVVETTGAGDAFNAGYLSRRLSGLGIKESVSTAQQLSAIVVQHRGAIAPPSSTKILEL